jgi:hypothetical protein
MTKTTIMVGQDGEEKQETEELLKTFIGKVNIIGFAFISNS